MVSTRVDSRINRTAEMPIVTWFQQAGVINKDCMKSGIAISGRWKSVRFVLFESMDRQKANAGRTK